MSSIDSSGEDHAYFQAIEARFIRLRGAPLLLSPADWQLARKWREAGIPLALVLETLDKVFAQRAERGTARTKVQGLRYCAPAVEAAWQAQAELQATGTRASPAALDLGARLESLSSTVRDLPLKTSALAERIASLQGDPEAVERALVDFDRELLSLAASELDDKTLEEIAEEVEAALANIGSRLAEREVAKVRDRLFRESVRRRWNLPVVSLFEDRF
jgi:hypothetical protein